MKVDFSSFEGGSGPAGRGSRMLKFPRRLIDRYLENRPSVQPLDDAHRTVRIGLIVASLFVLVFLVFAMLVPISGAAVAPGQVTVSGNRLVIQPVSSGLVSEVLVREGQRVAVGQPLVRLNGVRSGAQLRQAQARRDSLRALEARLIAERDGLPELRYPADLASRATDRSAAAAMQAQNAIFARHRAVLEADRQIAAQQVLAADASRIAAERQLVLMEDELGRYQELLDKGYATVTRVRALERSAAQLQSDRVTSGVAAAEARINQAKVRTMQEIDIVSQLSSVQDQLAQVDPQLDVSRYLADRDVMRAPAAGRVSGIAAVGPGTVVSGGRTLMEIVPDGRALIVEARIKPEDIDDVRRGAIASVRFSSVNPRGQSTFDGRVVTLSPARVEDSTGSYYRAQISLIDPAAAARAGVNLQPGIPVSVNVKTKNRTLWDYLISPLADAMSSGLREE